jgi:hypothetical protein
MSFRMTMRHRRHNIVAIPCTRCGKWHAGKTRDLKARAYGQTYKQARSWAVFADSLSAALTGESCDDAS